MNAVSICGDWVGQKIDGKFPLIAWLGGSGSSGVFVTEIEGQGHGPAGSAPGPRRAAIKLMPVSARAEERLALWSSSMALAHPHVVRILKTGRAAVYGTGLIYVVTELADEVLAQIVPERPLTADETREMTIPVLDALAYLHGKGYIHAHLKPSNIVVVEDQVKLSCDSLLPVGTSGDELPGSDFHRPPEMASGPTTPAADVWSLGMTMVEVLTQQHPIWDAASDAEAQIPASLPKPFAEIARQCLQIDPAKRCSLKEIRDLLEGNPRPTVIPRTEEPRQEWSAAAAEAKRRNLPLIAIVVGLILLAAVILGLWTHSHAAATTPLQTETTQQAGPAESESHPGTAPLAAPQAAPPATTKAEVLDRVVPDVPRSASRTIQGKVSVIVRVAVDATGAVSKAELTSHGPSAYFARVALESAHKWRFKPALQNGKAVESIWMLRYAFRRSGTDVTPAEVAP